MQHTFPATVERMTGCLRGFRASCYRSVCLVAILTLGATGHVHAQVQWNPFKPGFGKQAEPEMPVEPVPVAPPPLSVTTPAPRSASSPAVNAPQAASGAKQSSSPAGFAPLPPPRPANLHAGSPTTPPAGPRPQNTDVKAAAVEAAKAAASTGANPVPTTSASALARVNDWLNSYQAIQARFIQHNAQGQKAEGSLYVRRPGQLVFKYDPPSTLEIVADGKSVAVRDSKLRTNDVYSIGQTPLKFLLRDRVNLASDSKLLNVATDADGIIRVALSDSSTLGGTSKITLIFDSRANVLKQWNIIDPQGYQTTVALYDLQSTER